jgi:glucose/arabinose dehydrogenase
MITLQPAGDDRLYILERGGRIVTFRDGSLTTFFQMATPPLMEDGYSERGLLGLALHPEFAQNGRFFIFYTRASNDRYSTGGAGDVVIAEGHRSSSNANVADAETTPLFVIPHPEGTHNGGMLAFDRDGYLGASIGESCNDTKCGAILRIDVDEPGARPPGNFPAPVAPQVWVRGLRNPWRFTFDRTSGDAFIGDVGGDAWEEINVVRHDASEINLGWPVVEGNACRNTGCSMTGLTAPTSTYSSVPGDESRCVVGGYVYRGSQIPCLAGRYVYGDYATNQIFSFVYAGGQATDPVELTADLSTTATRIQGLVGFGEDASGELYLNDAMGHVYRIDRE